MDQMLEELKQQQYMIKQKKNLLSILQLKQLKNIGLEEAQVNYKIIVSFSFLFFFFFQLFFVYLEWAQMATVFAQLYVNNVYYGVHAFLVPLRDDNGKILPGIRIKDCGHKMGKTT